MKSLVIAEKPSVARDIARVLGASQKNGGVLEGKNYVVTWALGHLVTLADPEEYDKKYDRLKELEKVTGIILANSPTINVGSETVSELEKVEHDHPMLSLDKTKDINEVESFMNGL